MNIDRADIDLKPPNHYYLPKKILPFLSSDSLLF